MLITLYPLSFDVSAFGQVLSSTQYPAEINTHNFFVRREITHCLGPGQKYNMLISVLLASLSRVLNHKFIQVKCDHTLYFEVIFFMIITIV